MKRRIVALVLGIMTVLATSAVAVADGMGTLPPPPTGDSAPYPDK